MESRAVWRVDCELLPGAAAGCCGGGGGSDGGGSDGCGSSVCERTICDVWGSTLCDTIYSTCDSTASRSARWQQARAPTNVA
jgi:hypothetical protein